VPTGCFKQSPSPTITHPPTTARRHVPIEVIELTIEAAQETRWASARDTYYAYLGETFAAEATAQVEIETWEAFAPIEATIEALGDEAWCKSVEPDEAREHVGQDVCIVFEVVHTRRYGEQVFLNSHYPYENHFYVYIHRQLWDCWPQSPEVYFDGRRVIVWGVVEEYHTGWPEIVLQDCSDIAIVR